MLISTIHVCIKLVKINQYAQAQKKLFEYQQLLVMNFWWHENQCESAGCSSKNDKALRSRSWLEINSFLRYNRVSTHPKYFCHHFQWCLVLEISQSVDQLHKSDSLWRFNSRLSYTTDCCTLTTNLSQLCTPHASP